MCSFPSTNKQKRTILDKQLHEMKDLFRSQCQRVCLSQQRGEQGRKKRRDRGWSQRKTQLPRTALVASFLQLPYLPAPLHCFSIAQIHDFIMQSVHQLDQSPEHPITPHNLGSWKTSPNYSGLRGTFLIPNKYHIATDKEDGLGKMLTENVRKEARPIE